ncbi:MAG: hypothetical protein WBC54_03245 [Rhodococcus sp. (in: high G+C Gram-positive bacteria)]
MESLLLTIHVVAGILFVGPIAVVTSLFPRYAPSIAAPTGRSLDVAHMLHRITRVYGLLAMTVPVVGLLLAAVQGRMGEVWISAALVLTILAGGLLALVISPMQGDTLESPDGGVRLRRIGMTTGLFNVLWVSVVVLMIVRPGSSGA